MKSISTANHTEPCAMAGFSLLKHCKCDPGYVLGCKDSEIIEKWAEFSSSRVSHFQFFAKCNRPFVHIFPGVDHERGWNLCYYLNEAKQSTEDGRQRRGEPNSSRGSGRCLVHFWSLATISVHINVASDGTRNLRFDHTIRSNFHFFGKGEVLNSTDDSLFRHSGGHFHWQENVVEEQLLAASF